MTVSAVVTDLDGTFWSRSMRVHPATHDAVGQLDRAGIPLVIATGRRALGALSGLTPEGFGGRPGIFMNGALARDRSDGESFLVETIDAPAVDSMMDLFAAAGLEPMVYVDHPQADLLAGPQPAAGAAYLAGAAGVASYDSEVAFRRAVRDAPVIGLGAFGFPEAQLAPIAAAIDEAELATAIISPAIFEDAFGLMIQGRAVDKWTGIVAWCERHDIDPAAIAALGDGMNDLDMLTNAGVAIAPTNSVDAILDAADHHIEPNEDGGWSQLGDLLGL